MLEEKDIQTEQSEEMAAEHVVATAEEQTAAEPTTHAEMSKFEKLTSEDSIRKLTGMYKTWFLDYASYVILERAVPISRMV